MTDLHHLLERLRAGLAASGQGSYRRGLPAPRARSDLHAARMGLRELVTRDASVEAWRALSLAEEAFLDYPAAVRALEAAVAASQCPDRRDLKRLHQLRESAARWRSLALTPNQLAALATHLRERLAVTPCDHSLRNTREWLSDHAIASVDDIIRGIEQTGGYCDCEVVLNVV